ncbi:MAG TPA: hypothetical protein VGB09_05370 [Candidatus Binatia bacterium]
MPEAEIAAIVTRIAGDETLTEELRYWVSTLQIASLITGENINGARQVKAQIDAALESPQK